jgi:hypothetical protein
MALKRSKAEIEPETAENVNVTKASKLFAAEKKVKSSGKEKKILTTFSIEPSFKEDLEEMYDQMGLGWASGTRFALKYFQRNFKFQKEEDEEN